MSRYGLIAYLLLLSSIGLIGPEDSHIVYGYDTRHRLAFPRLKSVLFTIAEATEINLYEGLPHGRDREALQKELETQTVDKIADFPFYHNTIKLKDADKTWIKEFFLVPNHMSPYSGHKSCGGFHADFCVEWFTKSNHHYYCLICFGCEEAIVVCEEAIFLVENDFLRCDLGTDKSQRELFHFLFQHRKSRPLSRHLQDMIDRKKRTTVIQ